MRRSSILDLRTFRASGQSFNRNVLDFYDDFSREDILEFPWPAMVLVHNGRSLGASWNFGGLHSFCQKQLSSCFDSWALSNVGLYFCIFGLSIR